MLLAIAAALGGALYFTRSANDVPATPEQTPVFSFQADAVLRLEASAGARSLVVDRDAGGPWRLQPEAEAADNLRLNALSQRLASLRASRRIADTAGDLQTYGLAEPSLDVLVRLSGDGSHRLRIGAQTPVETGYYALADDGPEVLVVPTALVLELRRLVEQPPRAPATPAPRPSPAASPVSK